jgi:hypothetical protein
MNGRLSLPDTVTTFKLRSNSPDRNDGRLARCGASSSRADSGCSVVSEPSAVWNITTSRPATATVVVESPAASCTTPRSTERSM